MTYLGNSPTTQSFIEGTDYFNGDGTTTAFTLSRSVVSVNDIQATINNVVQQPNTAYTVSGTTITFISAPSAGTANIYVRYLSTTTQSITPSQNTVSYSTLNSDNQSKLGISFKNRIINGAMVIDQRNAGVSVTTGTSNPYIVDRWCAVASQNSKFTAQQNAGSVTPPAGFVNYLGATSSSAYSVISSDNFEIQQRIEGYNIADLNWGTANAQTITLSFWVRSSLTGTFGGFICNGATDYSYAFSYTISAANTWQKISVTIVGPSSGTWLTTNGIGAFVGFSLGAGSASVSTGGSWSNTLYRGITGQQQVVGTSGATWYVTGVQFEVGTQATTFDYRSYGTELALCQRYYFRLTNDSGGATSLTSFQVYGAGAAFGKICDLPVQMRSTPTGSLSAIGSFNPTNTAGANLTAFSTGAVDAVTKNTLATGGWGGSNSMTGGNCSVISIGNNAWIAASAEL